MLKKIVLLLFILVPLISFSQNTVNSSSILSENEIKEIFTEKLKSEFGITFPIYRVYNFSDTQGEYLLVLTERITNTENAKSKNDSIKAFCLKKNALQYSLLWKMNDFINKEGNESAIWFWTKYSEVNDLDNDGIIDPVVVYGTLGLNGNEDGRIKILIYYKNKKYAIRHQNGALDFQRNTKVDAEIYNLPLKIQNYIIGIMDKMVDSNQAIFPHNYKNQMSLKKVYFDDK